MVSLEYQTKDSGHRRVFESGAQRDRSSGKGDFWLIPFDGIKRVADLFERGAAKYEPRNWEKGMPVKEYIDSAIRHAFQASMGMTDEDHWAGVAWNAICGIATMERIAKGSLPFKLMDDMPEEIRNHVRERREDEEFRTHNLARLQEAIDLSRVRRDDLVGIGIGYGMLSEASDCEAGVGNTGAVTATAAAARPGWGCGRVFGEWCGGISRPERSEGGRGHVRTYGVKGRVRFDRYQRCGVTFTGPGLD